MNNFIYYPNIASTPISNLLATPSDNNIKIESTPISQVLSTQSVPQQLPTVVTPPQPISKNISNTPKIDELQAVVTNTETKLQKYENELTELQDKLNKVDLREMYNTILNIPKVIREQLQQPLLTMRTTNLVISSADRDLNNTSFNKYNFRVVFGAESDQFSDNIKYVSSGLKEPNIQQIIKNVVSIKLRRVIIPKPRDEVFYPEPTFFVCIDELDSNIFCTKTFSHKIFCKIHYDDTVTFGERNYLYYKNDDDDVAYYYPSPLAKLDRLTLRLVGSDGTNVSNIFGDSDIVVASGVTTGSPSTTFTSSTAFYNNTFKKDNVIDVTRDVSKRVTDISSSTIVTINTPVPNVQNGDIIVNLSNQIEYAFEVRTMEFDVNTDIHPIL